MRSFFFLIFGFFSFLFSINLQAQQTVNGIVLDELTKEPIAGAIVEIENTTFQVSTNEDGTFRIFIPESGTGFKVIFGKRKQVFSLTNKDEVTLLLPAKTTRTKTSLMVGKTMKGKVIDADSGEPISGANVEILNTTFRTQTDEIGEFTLYIPAGGTQLKIEYKNQKGKFEIGEKEEQLFALSNKISTKNKGNSLPFRKPKNETGTIVLLTEDDFKLGNLYNPIQLIQGVSSGALIARPGSDPNEAFDIRIRGIHSYSQRANPLIVIDGLPEANLESIDPMDIASFRILKDAASVAKYGIRGNNGVIEITTKSAQDTTFRVSYHGYFASENYAKRVPVLSKQEFIDLGGSDLGDEHNWLEEITQNAASAASHLSFSGGKNLKYYASLSYRNVNGILNKSGFENYGARLNLNYKTLKDRLDIGLILGANNRNINYSFPQAFRYATTFNPSAPIFENNLPNEGFFEVNRFDHFNPVGLIEQNVNEGEIKNYSGTIKGSFELVENLKISTLYAHQYHTDFLGRFFPSNSFFRGRHRGGEAHVGNNQVQNFNWETALNYEKTIKDLTANVRGGYVFQRIEHETNFTIAEGFLNDKEGYHNLELASTIDYKDYKTAHDITAYFGEVSLNYEDYIFLNASVRQEGSSWLGSDDKWGFFPAVGVGFDLGHFLDYNVLNHFKFRANYGISGNAPIQGFLSKQIFRQGTTIFQNGQFSRTGFFNWTNENSALTYEEKKEFDFGIDFGFLENRVQGSIDFFKSRTYGLIQSVLVESPPNFAPFTWENIGESSSKGIELNLYFDIHQNENFVWKSNLQLSKFRTTVEKWKTPFEQNTMPGAPGVGSVYMVRIEDGMPLGNIQGLLFGGFDSQGIPQFIDPDGMSQTDNRVIIGNGLPDGFLGFQNQLKYKNFELDFFIRSVFGHDVVNLPRLFYESPTHVLQSINSVKTEYFNPIQQGHGAFSDFMVEDGFYLKWDYITLAYNFEMNNQQIVKDLKIYFTLQNPLIFTKYSGADPEVRLTDRGASDNGILTDFGTSFIAFGFDRRDTYLPSKGWIFGLKVGF